MRRGDVVLVALKGDYGKPRPAVVLQSDLITEAEAESVVVCPMTSDLSGKREIRIFVPPSRSNGLRSPSEVMVEKLTGIPRLRARRVIGRLEHELFEAVQQAVLLVLGFLDAEA